MLTRLQITVTSTPATRSGSAQGVARRLLTERAMLTRSRRLLTARARPRPAVAAGSSADVSEPIGLGYASGELSDVLPSQLFKAMMHKIDHPAKFLPVTQVRVRAPTCASAAEAGAVWRSMHFAPTSTTLVEHVYADPSAGEIRFVGLDEDGITEGPTEVVNAMHTKPLHIEYFQRDRSTGERVLWSVPRSAAVAAIRATHDMAAAAAAAAADDAHHAKKA